MDRIEAWSRELFSFDVRPFLEERVFAPGEFILREGSFPISSPRGGPKSTPPTKTGRAPS